MLANVYEKNFKPLTKAGLNKIEKSAKKFLDLNFYPRIVLGPPYFRLADPHVVMITKMYKDTDNCLVMKYFNVGAAYGGEFQYAEYCVGDYAWIPEDEELHFYDLALIRP